MDTSNSLNETPRPVDFVLGRKVKQSELTQEDWVKIIIEVMGHVKPRLKYVSGMTEFRNYMNRSLRYAHVDLTFHTTGDVIDKTEGMVVHPRLQCVELCSLHCNSPLLKLFSNAHHAESLHEHNILLTREGNLLLHFCNFKLRASSNWDKHYLVESILMRPMKLNDLKLTTQHEGVMTESADSNGRVGKGMMCEGAVLCDGLYALIQRTANDKQAHLDELHDVLSEIDLIQGRIEGFPDHAAKAE